jgi:putative phosphoribosyl transferase
MAFKDRRDAGEQLAARLMGYKDRDDVLVLSLPRGGVVVGHEVAKALHCPLDLLIIRKIGFPTEPELAIGAVSETGAVVLNEEIISAYGITEKYIAEETSQQKEEIARRRLFYRSGHDISALDHRIIILVDDGVATGATLKAAIASLRKEKIARLVVAVPVASRPAEEEIEKTVDEWICLQTPDQFTAVGSYYRNFKQVSDEEVIDILRLQGTH